MLARALAMEWMSGVNFLEAGIYVTGNFSAYVGGTIHASVQQFKCN